MSNQPSTGGYPEASSVIGVDVGGTFTDVIALDGSGRAWVSKVSSTPEDYSEGVLGGIESVLSRSDTRPQSVLELLHGTTVATNAVLERKGAVVGLITTRGFKDTLELGRMRLGELYNLRYKKRAPLVEQRLIREVDVRIDSGGNVRAAVDGKQVELTIAELMDAGSESLAICLINSWANPDEEAVIEEHAKRGGFQYCSTSSEVIPILGEYERMSTTAINAYVQPLVSDYLRSLVQRCADQSMRATTLIMQSNGGLMSVERAMKRPAALIESGPAAGVIGAARVAEVIGLESAISFDMGGTTAKASLIERYRPSIISDYEVGDDVSKAGALVGDRGYALKLPAIDIAEVGAGGGSIVWIDSAGGMQVGPLSAGAVPGPACYGRGGAKATVTDANVVLGYINPTQIAGGSLEIDADAARSVVESEIAVPMGLPVEGAAWAAHVVANVKMMGVIRSVSSERGRDPRDFTLIAFGGSGPVHGAGIAEMLGIRNVVIPALPGVLSAFGLISASRTHRYVRSLQIPAGPEAVGFVQDIGHEMQATSLQEFDSEGAHADELVHAWSVGARYVGQGNSLDVDLDSLPSSPPDMVEAVERFIAAHKLAFGHNFGSGSVEIVEIHLRTDWLTRSAPAVLGGSLDVGFESRTSPGGQRPAYFGRNGWISSRITDRSSITPSSLDGPVIIEEADATTVVPPGWSIRRGDADSLLLEQSVSRTE